MNSFFLIHHRRVRIIVSSLFAVAAFHLRAAETNRVQIHFNQPADPPLVKKFALMNAGIVPADNYKRDLPAIQFLRPDSLRIDLSIGKTWNTTWSRQIVGGTVSNLTYYWPEIDKLSRDLNGYGVLPYWSFCYTPVPLQISNSWRSRPSSLAAWRTVHRDFARHFRDAGIKIGYYELYNEPDFREFFTGTPAEYLQMYKAGALGLREGDADAVLGGPALAFSKSWVEPFLDFVDREQLPLDFFSFHNIFPMEEKRAWHSPFETLKNLRAAIAKHPRFATTEFHLNEHHPYDFDETRRGAGVDKYPLAARIFDDIEEMLRYHDLTLVHWAQFMDCGWGDEAMGVVSDEGWLKPSYGAFAIYADMPVDRCAVAAPEPLHVLASADAGTACAVIWNRSDKVQPALVEFDSVPFAGGELRVHRIDAIHSATGQRSPDGELLPVETRKIEGDNLNWAGDIPPQGVVYLKLVNTVKPVSPKLPDAQIVRLHHYFPNRGGSAYAEFDRHTWTARLGMGGEKQVESLIGVTLSGCPDALNLAVKLEGNPRRLAPDSLLAVRVDYETAAGLTKSVLFHDGQFIARKISLPWGTGKSPDQIEAVNFEKNETLNLAVNAPSDWNRRAIISFIMQDTGPGSRAKFEISAAADIPH